MGIFIHKFGFPIFFVDFNNKLIFHFIHSCSTPIDQIGSADDDADERVAQL